MEGGCPQPTLPIYKKNGIKTLMDTPLDKQGSNKPKKPKSLFEAIVMQKASKKVMKMVSKRIQPMIQAQIDKAEKGDTQAFVAVFNRAFGAPAQSQVLSTKDNAPLKIELAAEIMEKNGLKPKQDGNKKGG